MRDIERQVMGILHDLNWMLEPHDSYAELVEIKGSNVVIHCVGTCVDCETDCIGTAFQERMPTMKLVRQ